jgi:hypothetical protein
VSRLKPVVPWNESIFDSFLRYKWCVAQTEDAAMKKIRVALCAGYLVAGMTAIWCAIVVNRLAELSFILG